MSTNSDGSIYFWGVRPNLRNRGECFLRSKNYNISAAGKLDTAAVVCTMFINQEMKEIAEDLLWKKEFTERHTMGYTNLGNPDSRSNEPSQRLKSFNSIPKTKTSGMKQNSRTDSSKLVEGEPEFFNSLIEEDQYDPEVLYI